MQNIDFSHRTRKRLSRIPAVQPMNTLNSDMLKPEKRKNPLAPFLAVAVLFLSIGIAFGIFITKAKEIEKNIISRPDSPRQKYAADWKQKSKVQSSTDSNSFTNIASIPHKHKHPSDKEASFLIKVGVYASPQAKKLALELNQIPGLIRQRANRCKDIQRNAPLEQLAFHIPVPGVSGQENVLLGCFSDKDRAMALLSQLMATNIPQTKDAKLYEIKD